MAYDEIKAYQCLSDKNSETQKAYVLSAVNNGCLAGKVLSLSDGIRKTSNDYLLEGE